MSSVVSGAAKILGGSGVGGALMGPIGSIVGGAMGASKTSIGGNLKGMIGQDGFNAQPSQFDPNLQRAIGLLENRAAGKSPSVAELQMKQGLDDTLSNTVSAIRSTPSLSPALRTRLIAGAGQDQMSELARAQSVLRAGEQAQAEQTLIGGLNQARQTDVGLENVRSGAAADKSKRRSDLFGKVVGGIGQAAFGGGM